MLNYSLNLGPDSCSVRQKMRTIIQIQATSLRLPLGVVHIKGDIINDGINFILFESIKTLLKLIFFAKYIRHIIRIIFDGISVSRKERGLGRGHKQNMTTMLINKSVTKWRRRWWRRRLDWRRRLKTITHNEYWTIINQTTQIKASFSKLCISSSCSSSSSVHLSIHLLLALYSGAAN